MLQDPLSDAGDAGDGDSPLGKEEEYQVLPVEVEDPDAVLEIVGRELGLSRAAGAGAGARGGA